MRKEIKKTTEFIDTETFCDECENKINWNMGCSVLNCEICKKDLCKNCIGHESFTPYDRREVYCKNCWEIGEYYRKEIANHFKIIEKLESEWENKCKLKNK